MASIVETHVILFFPGKCFQITPFGASFALTMTTMGSDNNYLLTFPELDERFFRQVFTGFEFVVFKVCHIVLEEQKADYHWETEKTRQRIRRLQPLLNISDWDNYFQLFDEIFYVRDGFAHSFTPLDRLKYKGVPLSECFGKSFNDIDRRAAEQFGAGIFTDDLAKVFDPVMNLFTQHQLKQIDSLKFEKFCDKLLTPRSLSPG
jgi:hypothetical protein